MNDLLFFAFPVFPLVLWILITFIFSKFGWSGLADRFRTDPAFFSGNNIGLISARINSINYNNCLILKYNEEGMLLKTIFLFRLFHPAILIPWNEIKEVEDKSILFLKSKKLVIGSPVVGTILLRKSTFEKFEAEIPLRSFANTGS